MPGTDHALAALLLVAGSAVLVAAAEPGATGSAADAADATRLFTLGPPPVKAPAPITGTLALMVGHDSNPLLATPSDSTASEASGAAGSLSGEVIWRAVGGDGLRLNLGADASYEWFQESAEARRVMAGASATVFGAWKGSPVGELDPSLTLSAHRMWLDTSEFAADIIGANGNLVRVGERHVAEPSLALYRVRYDNDDDATGWLVDGGYDHWFLVDPDGYQQHRRFELGVHLQRYAAGDEAFSWWSPVVAAGARWRLGAAGDGATFGTVDLGVSANAEWRRYQGDEAERQRLFSLTVSADATITRWLAAGPFWSGSLRDASIDGNEFHRNQVGLQATASW